VNGKSTVWKVRLRAIDLIEEHIERMKEAE